MTLWPSLLIFAGVYINGVQVDGLRGQTFRGVDITFDEQGNIVIDAKGYDIQVVGEAATYPGPAAAAPVTSTSTTVQAPAQPLAPGTWWLATEDQQTTGHVVDILINGNRVDTVRSGQPQRILDLSSYLRRGANTVRMQATSTAPTGGSLLVYVGSGSNQSGTVVLDAPDIQFGIRANANGPLSREYTLTVP